MKHYQPLESQIRTLSDMGYKRAQIAKLLGTTRERIDAVAKRFGIAVETYGQPGNPEFGTPEFRRKHSEALAAGRRKARLQRRKIFDPFTRPSAQL